MGKKTGSKSKDTKGTNDESKGKQGAKLNVTWNHEAHIKYRLSDKEFVKLGWTKLPTNVVIQKMTTYRTFSSKQHMLLFKRRHGDETKFYPDRSRAAVFKANGTGSIYYPDGRIAIHYQNKTYIVLSPGGKDPLTGYIRAQVVTALFDTMGNGVVYDNEGRVVINYTQRHGVYDDTKSGLPMKWSWPVKIKEDDIVIIPECQKSQYLDESIARASNEEVPCVEENTTNEPTPEAIAQNKKDKSKQTRTAMHSLTVLYETSRLEPPTEEDALEDHEKSKVGSTSEMLITTPDCSDEDFLPYFKHMKNIKKSHPAVVCAPIKPIFRKLNQYMSLRIIDQATVNLTFCACGQIFRLELGVVIDPSDIVKVNNVVMKDSISIHGVVNYFEQFPNQALQNVLNRLIRQRDWSAERMKERERIANRCGGFI